MAMITAMKRNARSLTYPQRQIGRDDAVGPPPNSIGAKILSRLCLLPQPFRIGVPAPQ
jgi:hypothetical protein